MEMIVREIKHFDENGLREIEEVNANWMEIRSIRNESLKESDWRFMSDQSPSDEWIAYRVFLRDLPQNYDEANDAADAWNEYEIPE